MGSRRRGFDGVGAVRDLRGDKSVRGFTRSLNLLTLLLCFLVVLPCSALGITVKYRATPVDVSNGHFQEFALKPSSLVQEIFYDLGNEYLLVRLKQTFSHYCGIPKAAVREWVAASSLGRH